MAGPLQDYEIGPLLGDKDGKSGLHYKYISGWGPDAIWEVTDKSTRVAAGGWSALNKGQRLTQAELADLHFGSRSPYYLTPAPKESATQNINGRVMQWNPQGGGYTIDLGPAGGGTAPSGAGLPAGFVQKNDGLIYKQAAGGLVLATDEDVASINAPPGRGFAPQHSSYTEEPTGDRVFTVDGRVVSRIPGAAWAALSPAQQQAADSAARKQIDDALMARQQASDMAQGQRSAAGDVAAGERTAAQAASAANVAQIQADASRFGDLTRLAPQLGDLALKNAGFTRDTLKTPPDYLARAFFQQGQTSPLPQVSQADIINHLRTQIQGFNTALSGFGASAPSGAPPIAPVPRPAPAPPVAATRPYFTAAGGINPAYVAAGGQWQPTPNFPTNAEQGFATGGFTTAPVMRVGEAPSGAPNATEETVVNPTNAPVGVIPNPQTQNAQQDPEAKKRQAKADAIGRVIGFVDDRDLQHALVDEMAKHRPATPSRAAIPRFAWGSGFGIGAGPGPEMMPVELPPRPIGPPVPVGGVGGEDTRLIGPPVPAPATSNSGWGGGFHVDGGPSLETAPRTAPAHYDVGAGAGGGGAGGGFSGLQLPVPGAANQTEIQALERRVRPPALNTLLNGGMPGEPRFGFNLFTPMQLAALTPDDRAALQTTLATQFNETPENVEYAINRRWSTGRRRMVAGVGF